MIRLRYSSTCLSLFPARLAFWCTAAPAAFVALLLVIPSLFSENGAAGIGWGYGLIWIPTLLVSLIVGCAIIAAFARRKSSNADRTCYRLVLPVALWTMLLFAASAAAVMVADALQRSVDEYFRSSTALLSVIAQLLVLATIGSVTGLGTIALSRSDLAAASPAESAAGTRPLIGAGLGAATVGSFPFSVLLASTDLIPASVPFIATLLGSAALSFAAGAGITALSRRRLHRVHENPPSKHPAGGTAG